MRFFKSLIGLIAGILVLGVSGVLFVVDQATESHTAKEGEFEVQLLQNDVSIVWNKFGVPHVVATSDHDAFFGLGFCHAQDRLFQMDFARRTAQGRLSEAFGRDLLPVDLYFRSMEIDGIAQRVYNTISADSRMAIDAYAAGVNAYLELHESELPFEFNALEYSPERWTGKDCLLMHRMMAWELSVASWLDVAYAGVAEKIGRSKASKLIPPWPQHAPTVLDTGALPSFASVYGIDEVQHVSPFPRDSTQEDLDSLQHNDSLMMSMFQTLQTVRSAIGMQGSANGSNSWAWSRGTKRSQPRATLANDPHLTFSLPARWYQAHLTSPQLNVVGLTIPGLPFVVAGRNDHIAWGVTNIMLDDMDYFKGSVDPNSRKSFVMGDKSVPFTYIRDTIVVKDSTNVIYDRRYANNYAVVSDVHLFHSPAFTHTTGFAIPDDQFLVCKWTATLASDEILAMYRLNKASDWDRFKRAVSIFTTPGLNFTYADTKGNIGVAPAGRIPLRQNHPQFADDIRTMKSAWTGYVMPDEWPRLYNPKRGWVFSANNKTTRSTFPYVSSYWEPSSRAQRIAEVLHESEQHTALEAGILQKDIYSVYASELLPSLLHVVEPFRNAGSIEVKHALDTLAQWNYKLDIQSVSASIYTVWQHVLTKNLIEDELGEELTSQVCFISSVPSKILWNCVVQGEHAFVDNVETSHVESMADIAFNSLVEALDTLQARFETTDMSAWHYGELHTVELPHRFGGIKPLDAVVNIGPFPYPGDNTTVNNGEYKFTNPYEVHLGPSMRMIADMNDSVLLCILPGGQSGQPLSGQYGNQVQLWLNGGTIRLPVSREPEQNQVEQMLLTPISRSN